MNSMTGFSERGFSIQGTPVRLQIRSWNHKGLDIRLRLPRMESPKIESWLKQEVEAHVKRGSVEVFFEIQSPNVTGAEALPPALPLERVEFAYHQLVNLKKRLGLEVPIGVQDILGYPEVLLKTPPSESLVAREAEWISQFQEEFRSVLKDFLNSRQNEGIHLLADLRQRVSLLRAALDQADGLRPALREKFKDRVQKRLAQAFEAYPSADVRESALFESRLSQEVAFVLEKQDIEEEMVRFKGHLEVLSQVLVQPGPHGKRLDFIYQELHREITTLSNKAQDVGMSQIAVDIKLLIDQMREQSLNLE